MVEYLDTEPEKSSAKVKFLHVVDKEFIKKYFLIFLSIFLIVTYYTFYDLGKLSYTLEELENIKFLYPIFESNDNLAYIATYLYDLKRLEFIHIIVLFLQILIFIFMIFYSYSLLFIAFITYANKLFNNIIIVYILCISLIIGIFNNYIIHIEDHGCVIPTLITEYIYAFIILICSIIIFQILMFTYTIFDKKIK